MSLQQPSGIVTPEAVLLEFDTAGVADASRAFCSCTSQVPTTMAGTKNRATPMRMNRRESHTAPGNVMTKNVRTERETDGGAIATAILTLLVIENGALEVKSSGLYRGEVVREDDAWRFASLHLTLDLPF